MNKSRKHYISLLVHENVASLINLFINFNKFYKEATIVVHISPSSNFTRQNLINSIQLNKINNVIINPYSCSTSWGNIIKAHFLNIKLIKELGDSTHISFHSSNELFIKRGIFKYIYENNIDNLFNTRFISEKSNWWPGQSALRDTYLNQVLSYVNPSFQVIGGQIEGSLYKSDLIFEMEKLVTQFDFLNSESKTLYPREEILFPSLAYNMNIKSNGLPFVFSEIQIFDKKIFAIINFLKKIKVIKEKAERPDLHKIIKYFSKKMLRKNSLTVKDIDSILLKKHPINTLFLNDGISNAAMFNTKNIYSVKRVPRDISHKIVQYISKL